MCGKTEPQGVYGDMLRNAGLPDGRRYGVLDGFFTQVMPPDLPAPWVYGQLGRGENILPFPFLCVNRIF